MKGPLAGVVRIHRDRERAARWYEHRIAHGTLKTSPVDRHDLKMMAVQVHRVRHHRLVAQRHLNPVSLIDGQMRVGFAYRGRPSAIHACVVFVVSR